MEQEPGKDALHEASYIKDFRKACIRLSERHAETVFHAPPPWLRGGGVFKLPPRERLRSRYSHEGTADETIYTRL